MIDRTTASESATIDLASAFASCLRPGDVLALHGDLGAGKTRFVRGLAVGLGLDPADVSSPTFVIVNEYASSSAPLIHIDAYRLEHQEDLDALGWDRIFDGTCIVAIEWAERLADHLPPDRFEITIDHAGPEHRRIVIQPPPGREATLSMS
ncbi:MAG: tRNA (adenosine(37)-N6)-threonylcarbamoyltransferase complex ATPase subunit type 1 TsaE [Planctomycetota bacterium]